jgi:hypothetical protein
MKIDEHFFHIVRRYQFIVTWEFIAPYQSICRAQYRNAWRPAICRIWRISRISNPKRCEKFLLQ